MKKQNTKHSIIYDDNGDIAIRIYKLDDGVFMVAPAKLFKMTMNMDRKQVHIWKPMKGGKEKK